MQAAEKAPATAVKPEAVLLRVENAFKYFPVSGLGGRCRLDTVLELVYLRVEVVDEVEVALCDVVDEPVQHHSRAVVGSARFACGPWVVGLLARRRLAHGDQ